MIFRFYFEHPKFGSVLDIRNSGSFRIYENSPRTNNLIQEATQNSFLEYSTPTTFGPILKQLNVL
ncbi:unnamed protein product [Meloidogyne enterolobii]|uniref:Uncharacterized protein n=1 Tax=Meloidogyne enterolobii TaxID=390850 RepID=A0ACB1AYY0_MELEN